jgi:hypothetical protein
MSSLRALAVFFISSKAHGTAARSRKALWAGGLMLKLSSAQAAVAKSESSFSEVLQQSEFAKVGSIECSLKETALSNKQNACEKETLAWVAFLPNALKLKSIVSYG